jgi:hypothetical protein
MKNQINNSISAIAVAICLLIVVGCKFSTADLFTTKENGNSETTNRSNRTSDQTETDNQMSTSSPTPGSSKTPLSSTPSNGSTVDFPARVGIWRLSKTAKGSEITTSSREAREIFGSAVTANAAVYVSPDGKQVIWSDNQFDSQERARKITGGIVSRVRESKTLRIIYDTPANGTMFADAQDAAVAFSFSGNSVQMFIGQGSENLRSFISAASKQ